MDKDKDFLYWVHENKYGDKRKLDKPIPLKGWKKGTKKVDPRDSVVGKVYFKLNEIKPIVVTCNNRSSIDRIRFQYLNHLSISRHLDAKHLLEAIIETEKEETMTTNKLYQVIGTETYGTQLATNSEGKIVLEVKGTGEVITKSKKELEEVFPFTFGVEFVGGNNTVYHYLGTKESVTVNDLLILDNGFDTGICKVVSVDTKSSKATKEFNGTKLLTAPIN